MPEPSTPELRPIRLDRPCPKCGGKDIDTRWRKRVPFASYTSPNRLRDRLTAEEHLHRTCRTCQFKWAAKPLDLCSAVDRLGAVAP